MSAPNTLATSTSTTITKLPSIQSMLEGISLNDERQHAAAADTRSFGHRRHLSEHSAFTLVQKDKAPPLEPKIEHIPSLTKVTTASALSTSPPDATLSSTYYSRVAQLQHPHPHHPHRHHPQQHSPRNLHSRSFSDYTHPYPTCSPPRTTGTHLAPLQHRRAVSTNTLDLILQPLMQRPLDIAPPLMYSSSSTSSVTTNSVPDDHYEGYHSDETTHSERSVSPTPATATKSGATAGKTDNKIHTYSHTGERPFECPEAGCSRKFSVQSNMRRHLRVHRLGRPLKRNGGLISPADRAHLINKPLAAKPTTTASSNWIGVTVYPSSS
ncbi:hypothetical protein MBANPS3_011487 [Mucor bainieri]